MSLPSLLNIRCVVVMVMGGFGQEDSVVRDGAAGGVVTIRERLFLKKECGVVLEGVDRALH